jgi:hypothetical protein
MPTERDRMKTFKIKAGETLTINRSIVIHSTSTTTLKIVGPSDLHCHHSREGKCKRKENCEKAREKG